MANAINSTTNNFGAPYITIQEFKNAPTTMDIDNLVYNSIDPDVQDTELANVIARASSWIDSYCNQILVATTETETQRNRVRNDGSIRFHPRYNPIVALTNLQFGANPNILITVPDCSVCWLENQEVIFPYATQNYIASGTGQTVFGGAGYAQGTEVFLKYSYINGYANTALLSPAVTGDLIIEVENPIGIMAGQSLRIYDPIRSETVVVADTYEFGSRSVPVTLPLVASHEAGIAVSALPQAIKQAAILMTTAYLKVRGDKSMVMNVTNSPSVQPEGAQGIGLEEAMARQLLLPYRRIR